MSKFNLLEIGPRPQRSQKPLAMQNDLNEITERLKVARSQIGQLKPDVDAFLKENVQVRRAIGGNASVTLQAKLSSAVPTDVRSRAGMIANEIRSCLDGLACVLAVRNGKTTSGVYFPVCESKQRFDDEGLKKIKKLSAGDQVKISNLQPHKNGNRLLWGLHRADVTRKHVRLVASTVASSRVTLGTGTTPPIAIEGPAAGIRITDSVVGGFYVKDTILNTFEEINSDAWVSIAKGKLTAMPIRPQFNITYAEPNDLVGLEIISALESFCSEVEKIVGQF